MRRSRIVAGRYQVMGMSLQLLPWKNPLLVWQIISHKFMRPLVPFAMIFAFMTNLLAFLWPPALLANRLLFLSPPYPLICLSLQCTFYFLAWIGHRLKGKGLIGKLLYIPTFLVDSNASALQGLLSFLSGGQTVLWERVSRREIIPGAKQE